MSWIQEKKSGVQIFFNLCFDPRIWIPEFWSGIQIPVKDNRNYYENYIDHIITNNILLDSNDYYDDNNINIYNYNFIYGYYNNIDKSLYYYRFIDKNKNIDKEYYYLYTNIMWLNYYYTRKYRI